MKITPKFLIATVASLVLVIGLGVGGYYLSIRVGEMHEENVGNLADFGTKVIPIRQGADANSVTTNTEGQVQLPPTMPDEKLSPTERVIISLSQQKEKLLEELAAANRQVSELETELALAKSYLEQSTRFAPPPLEEERNQVANQIRAFLDTSSDARRFNDFQKDAMTAASASTYLDLLRQYRLAFGQTEKELIINQHLPVFAFCLGDSVQHVVNNRSEQRMLLAFLRDNDPSRIEKKLLKDLDSIKKPCLKLLSERVSALI